MKEKTQACDTLQFWQKSKWNAARQTGQWTSEYADPKAIVVRSQPEVLQSCGKEPAVAMETSLCYASELQSALNPIPYC